MAKTKGPLLSLEAHGTLAKTLNYSAKKSGSQVRKHHYPQTKVTGAQWTQRHIMGMLTARWQTLTDEEKAPYIASAKIAKPVITGFNYFVRVAQADLKTRIGLVAYYSMNETSGATIYDASGKNNGTLKPLYPSNCPARVSSLNEKYGNALKFNGVDQYVDTNQDFISTFVTDFAVSAWIKIDNGATGALQRVASIYDSISGDYVSVHLAVNGRFLGQILVDGRVQDTTTDHAIFSIEGNDWIHVVAVFDKSHAATSNKGFTLYINGAIPPQTSNGDAITGDYAAAKSLYIGASNNDGTPEQFIGGIMDDFTLWNRALLQNDVKKLYNLMRKGKKRQPLTN